MTTAPRRHRPPLPDPRLGRGRRPGCPRGCRGRRGPRRGEIDRRPARRRTQVLAVGRPDDPPGVQLPFGVLGRLVEERNDLFAWGAVSREVIRPHQDDVVPLAAHRCGAGRRSTRHPATRPGRCRGSPRRALDNSRCSSVARSMTRSSVVEVARLVGDPSAVGRPGEGHRAERALEGARGAGGKLVQVDPAIRQRLDFRPCSSVPAGDAQEAAVGRELEVGRQQVGQHRDAAVRQGEDPDLAALRPPGWVDGGVSGTANAIRSPLGDQTGQGGGSPSPMSIVS